MADRKTTTNRGMRDEAGVGPNPAEARRLVRLKELDDYKVAEGEPDIRGWNVYTATGRELGDVEDLLVDTDAGEVVMVDIDLKRDDRHTLAPIKAAWIDRPNRRVVLNTAMFDVDDAIPALSRRNEPVESESVRHFNERYERAYGADGWDRDRDITIRHANDDFRISRSVPPQRLATDRPVDVPPSRTADTIERTGAAIDRGAERVADSVRDRDLQPERRRYVRYGPSRDRVGDEVVGQRRSDAADLSPAETERLRQLEGDVTTDARDTLVSRPPTEERR
jgi:sporulation protein YlmC with PRC-barrel domain